MSIPSQLIQASILKYSRPQKLEKRASGKRVKVFIGTSLSGVTIQIANVMGEILA
jgi:hypothetical protein